MIEVAMTVAEYWTYQAVICLMSATAGICFYSAWRDRNIKDDSK